MRRRQFLWTSGTAAMGTSVLAGCIRGEDTIPGEEYPAVDEWLTEKEVGSPDDTYDGFIVDNRGKDEVQIEVGVKGNGGSFAFGPSAVAITAGTTVRWVWTGKGGVHNIIADPEEQIGKSNYEFASGALVSEVGHEYTRTLDDGGIALYHCDGVTGIHNEVSTGSSYEFAATVGFTSARLPVGPLEKAPVTAMHLEPHLSLGMKGGIAVTK